MSTTKHYDYIIVGAGLFGATFAHLATKKGRNVLSSTSVIIPAEISIARILRVSMSISTEHISSILPTKRYGIS